VPGGRCGPGARPVGRSADEREDQDEEEHGDECEDGARDVDAALEALDLVADRLALGEGPGVRAGAGGNVGEGLAALVEELAVGGDAGVTVYGEQGGAPFGIGSVSGWWCGRMGAGR
jgi:hypothetical protein